MVNKNIAKSSAALITGGAKRIGRKIAKNLAKSGYDLAITYNESRDEAEKLALEISEEFLVNCKIFQCDLKNQNQINNLIKFMKINFPKWNLLINNASIFNKSKFLTGSSQEMMDNLNIHLISPLILAKEFAKYVEENSIENAQIINMIDKNIVRYDTSYFYYLLSKKSLAELTKMLALELSPKIRVNGIAPGYILDAVDWNESDEVKQNIIKKIPLEKKGDIKNIWQSIEFLLKNDFINGQIIFVDGGASLNNAG